MKTVQYNNHLYVLREIVQSLNYDDRPDVAILNDGLQNYYLDNTPILNLVSMQESLRCYTYDTSITLSMMLPIGHEAHLYEYFARIKQISMHMIECGIVPFRFLVDESSPVEDICLDDAIGYWSKMDTYLELPTEGAVAKIHITLCGTLYTARLPPQFQDKSVFEEKIRVTARTLSKDTETPEGKVSELTWIYFDLIEDTTVVSDEALSDEVPVTVEDPGNDEE